MGSKGEMQKIDRELEVDDEEQLFLDRCDAGLFTLQQIDITLVRLANMGNRQASDEIGKLMDAKGVPVSEVCDTLDEYCSHLDGSAKSESDEIRNFLNTMVKRNKGDTSELAPEEDPVAASGTHEKKKKKDKKDKKDARNDSHDESKSRIDERRSRSRSQKRPEETRERKEQTHRKEKRVHRSDSSDGA